MRAFAIGLLWALALPVAMGAAAGPLATQNDEPFDLPIVLLNCDRAPDPPYGPANPEPEGCQGMVGVGFEVITADGTPLGACTSDIVDPSPFGRCTVPVPYGTEVVVTEDGSTAAAGWAPVENPITLRTPSGPGAAEAPRASFVNLFQTPEERADGALTIYNTACPPGYDGDDHFADCYDNPVVGARFAISSPKVNFFADATTDADGFATLPLPSDFPLGSVDVSASPVVEVPGSGAPPFVAVCTEDDGRVPVETRYGLVQRDPGGDAYTLAVAAASGDEIRCDWYTIPPVPADAPPGDGAPTTAPDGGIASGGIGLTRAAWEAAHGRGEPVEIAHPLSDLIYAYEDGTYHVAFSDAKPGAEAEAVVLFVEMAWAGGISVAEAEDAARALLPVDAVATGPPYVGLPTPDGPIALTLRPYASAALDGVPYGAPDVSFGPGLLVAYHESSTETGAGDQLVVETTVSRLSIMTGIPEG